MKVARFFAFAATMILVACSAVAVNAGNIPVAPDVLANLVGGNSAAVNSMLISDMSMGNMKSKVYSRTYTGDNGLYAYLYQIDNTGVAGNSSLELFTLWPFTGADDNTLLGYLSSLSGIESDGFLSYPGYDPESLSYVDLSTNGPEMTFYFTKRNHMEIPPTKHSKVLYVVSPYAPTHIIGNVIDGAVGSGPVYGPVPEPGTLVQLLLGGLAALGFAASRRTPIAWRRAK